ncbi:MAG: hypothetical protein GC183_08480 [Thiobacillus sp.]|nr:hypothetical protein [Thiobacillus sp.]
MSKSLVELQRQRGQLIERIAHQRAALAREAAPFKVACDTTDWALTTVRDTVRKVSGLVQRHPAATAGLVAALVALKPRGMVRLLGRTIVAWRTWRSLRLWLTRR